MPDYRVIVHNNDTRAAEVVWEHEYANAPLAALKQIVMRKDSVVMVPVSDTTVVLDPETLEHIRIVLDYVRAIPAARQSAGITTIMTNTTGDSARAAWQKLQEMGLVSG